MLIRLIPESGCKGKHFIGTNQTFQGKISFLPQTFPKHKHCQRQIRGYTLFYIRGGCQNTKGIKVRMYRDDNGRLSDAFALSERRWRTVHDNPGCRSALPRAACSLPLPGRTRTLRHASYTQKSRHTFYSILNIPCRRVFKIKFMHIVGTYSCICPFVTY